MRETFSTLVEVNQAILEHQRDIVKHSNMPGSKLQTVQFPMNILNVMRVNQQHIPRETGGFVYLRPRPSHKASSVPKAILQTHVGSLDSVQLINLLNLEIDWHTHVNYADGRSLSPPSPADYMASLFCYDFFGAQVSLVMTKEGVYVMWPSRELLQKFMKDEKAVAEAFKPFSVQITNTFFNRKAFSYGDLSDYYSIVWNFGFRVYLVSWKDIQNAASRDPGGASGFEFSFFPSKKPVNV